MGIVLGPDGKPATPNPEPCNHGITFDEEAAKGLDEYEVRKRWPRGWFGPGKPCPKGCGFFGIYYASTAHYVYGDW